MTHCNYIAEGRGGRILNEKLSVTLTEVGNRMQEFGKIVIGIIEKIKEETKIDFEDLSQKIDEATELNKKAMELNVKEGWGMLMRYTPSEYITPMAYSGPEKEEYFVNLIESDKIFELEYEDLKRFMGDGWAETLDEAYILIENGNYRPIIPLFISILEKSMNKAINGNENFFGGKLKTNFQLKVSELREDDLLKPFALEMVPLLIKYIFKNGINSHEELPIFNRNLIQHGNDIPDRWSKTDFYKIFTLICGVSYICKELNKE